MVFSCCPMTDVAEGPSSYTNIPDGTKLYSNRETEDLKLELLNLYSELHNNDRNHKNKPMRWLDFESKAKHYLEKKKALVAADKSNTIDVHARCIRNSEGKNDESGAAPDQASDDRLMIGEDHLTVPKEDDPEAKKHNDAYIQIVLKQSNTFIAEKHESLGMLKEAAGQLETFGKKVKKTFGFGLPMVAWVPFSDSDPCWIKAMIVALDRTFTDRAKYYIAPQNATDPNNQSYTYPLPEKKNGPLRICVVGDIGTNDKIHKNTLKAIKAQNPDIILHLGDIYICGTDEECEQFWRIYEEIFPNPSSRPPFFSLPGNHEYIDAGVGYFNTLIGKNRFGYDPSCATADAAKRPQSTSFFELLSSKYNLQILGLDTGYNSKNFTLPFGGEEMDYSTSLNPEEATWAQTKLRRAKANGMNTIVLTHHQYYSAGWRNKVKNSILGDQILCAEQPIVAWLWGHEHRVGVYEAATEGVNFGACLGHGAMPAYGALAYAQPDTAPFKFDPTFTPDCEKVFHNFDPIYGSGFAMLEVHDATNVEMICYQVSRSNKCTEKGRRKVL